MNSKRFDEDAFTMVELLVAIAIIGLLSAIAIPVFLSHQKGAAMASMKSDLGTQKIAVATELAENSDASNDELNDSLSPTSGDSVAAVSGDGSGYEIEICEAPLATESWNFDSTTGKTAAGTCAINNARLASPGTGYTPGVLIPPSNPDPGGGYSPHIITRDDVKRMATEIGTEIDKRRAAGQSWSDATDIFVEQYPYVQIIGIGPNANNGLYPLDWDDFKVTGTTDPNGNYIPGNTGVYEDGKWTWSD